MPPRPNEDKSSNPQLEVLAHPAVNGIFYICESAQLFAKLRNTSIFFSFLSRSSDKQLTADFTPLGKASLEKILYAFSWARW